MQSSSAATARRVAARRLLNVLTAGIAFASMTGVGVLGGVAAITIPGVSASTQAASATTTVSDSSTTSSSSSESLQAPSSTVSSSPAPAVVVSGGSH